MSKTLKDLIVVFITTDCGDIWKLLTKEFRCVTPRVRMKSFGFYKEGITHPERYIKYFRPQFYDILIARTERGIIGMDPKYLHDMCKAIRPYVKAAFVFDTRHLEQTYCGSDLRKHVLAYIYECKEMLRNLIKGRV